VGWGRAAGHRERKEKKKTAIHWLRCRELRARHLLRILTSVERELMRLSPEGQWGRVRKLTGFGADVREHQEKPKE